MKPAPRFQPIWNKENKKYFIFEKKPIYNNGEIIGYDEKRVGTTDDAPQELKDLFAEWQKVYADYKAGKI